jgi:NAD(P)-dependent dehydrogenase (short-subunit alcohol dehydrogenase family)
MEPLAKPTAKELPAALPPVDLAERTILVTGASGGFGRALALECGRAGASVVLAGRNGAKLDRLYD